MQQPSLFISHGAPDLALADIPARQFLVGLGRRLARPDAIVIASAHHGAAGPMVRAPERFETLHDFGNFGPELFDLRYEPPGAQALGEKMIGLLGAAGLEPQRDPSPRIDHGAWVPLSLLFPAADVPVAMVSVDPARDAAWHERVGRALAPLRRRNVLVIGSGSISHNLGAIFSARPGADRRWVEAFTQWIADAAEAGDRDSLLSAMETAPEAARNHPTDEHFLPFYVALGAGDGASGRRIHHSYDRELLAMDAYAFGEGAEGLTA